MSSAVQLVDAAAIARDVGRVVRVPSITGNERAAAVEIAALARDMRPFCDRGIPCVLCGPSGIRVTHAVDEHVAIADLVAVAPVIVRSALAFAAR
ncbi:MAG TPA: hypothetical protein VGO80_00510 [Solirubrobacteraceae bacterium]|nr:hypothetical protein [Solirubrobacteraceae bacterium]